MDDTARLVLELHGKLDELNGKVAAYQKDILAQFRRHMDDCLKDYPDHVSNEVSRVITESMGRFSALTSAFTDQNYAPSPIAPPHTGDRKLSHGRKSPPPILYHTSGIPKDGLRSSHEREKEFQGVFTPSYLPLLDGSDRNHNNSAPASPMPAGPTFPLSVENVQKVEEIKRPKDLVTEARPQPIRRLTDRSSSIDSTSSDIKVRRSALRRTSSSIKGSPRRVRFEFQGAEVFPSVSPEESMNLGVATGGDGASGAEAESPPADTSAVIALEDDSPAYSGTSLLDVEGEEDFLPRPKKVSSTQALQALSRSPLDADGTVWTMVNSDPDEPAKMKGVDELTVASKAAMSEKPVNSTKPGLKVDVRQREKVFAPSTLDEMCAPPRGVDNSDGEESSDDEFLSMKPKSFSKATSPVARSPAVPLPVATKSVSFQDVPRNGSGILPKSSRFSASRTRGPLDLQSPADDEDGFFSFEDEGDGQTSQLAAGKYIDGDDDDDGGKVMVHERSPSATSPAMAAGTGEITPPDEEPVTIRRHAPVSPSAAMFSHSIGSYKGTSVMISPISNSKLYDEIARSMNDVPLFVGGIDGRTGVDTADMGSYRANLTRNLAGTPRSFTERLALEEAMERKRLAEKADALD